MEKRDVLKISVIGTASNELELDMQNLAKTEDDQKLATLFMNIFRDALDKKIGVLDENINYMEKENNNDK